MISKQQLDVLADIFSNTERPDKISVRVDPASRKVVIEYDGLDEEWFKELIQTRTANA